MDLKEAYNKIAEDWYQDHKQGTWWTEGTDKFISFLKQGSLVLDVGCGGGTKSQYMINKGLKVIGIDFSEKMIEIAKREVPKNKFLVMDMQDIGKLEKNFDGIFLQAVLLHIKKKAVKGVLQKLLEKLKKGGYVYVAVKEIGPKGVVEKIKTEEDYGYPYERFFSYFTLDEIRGYLEKLGIKVIYEDITPQGNIRWIQVIGQK